MKRQIDIIQAIKNPKLFGSLFKTLHTWAAWLVWLKAVFVLPLDQAEIEIYRRCTKRTDSPSGGFKEAACVVGRRTDRRLHQLLLRLQTLPGGRSRHDF